LRKYVPGTTKSNCNADQPLLRDQGQVITRDERALIVKAEHLGVITGVDIALRSNDGTEAYYYYALVNDEVNSTTQVQESASV
jgi:hypothetical protein